MTRLSYVIFAGVFAVAACGGVEPDQALRQRNLGKADDGAAAHVIDNTLDGQTVELDKGQSLTVELDSNPSTGYSWQVVAVSKGLDVNDQGYTPDEPQATGSGGIQSFSVGPNFTASAGSTHLLRLAYFRSWEGSEASVETFEITIKIR